MNRLKKYKPLILVASLFVVLFLLSISLVFRDLEILVQSKQNSLKQSLRVAVRTIPYELLEASLNTKEAQTQSDELLLGVLRDLSAEFQLQGPLDLLIYGEGQSYRLVSSQPGFEKGESFLISHEQEQKLTSGKDFASGLQYSEDGFYMAAMSSISLPGGQQRLALKHRSQQASLFYEIASFVLHYVLLFLSVLAISLGFYIYSTRKSRTQVMDLEFIAEQLKEESRESVFLLDRRLRITDSNAASSSLFLTPSDDLDGLHVFNEDELPLTKLDTDSETLKKRFEAREETYFKAKIQLSEDRARYVRAHWMPLPSGNASILVLRDITRLVLREDSGLDAVNFVNESNFVDPLTKLPNHNYLRSFYGTKETELKDQISSMLLLKTEFFDQADIPVSRDQKLIELSNFLRSFFRKSDSVIRYQDDQFIVLLSSTDLKRAARIASNLSDKLAAQGFQISAGVAQLDTKEGLEDWLTRATAALENARTSQTRVEAQEVESLEIIDP